MRSLRQTRAASCGLMMCLAGCAVPVGQQKAGIVGGSPTEDFPEVVALLFDEEFHCSAVLIGGFEVATAAHCVYGFENDLAPLSVAFGSDLSQAPPQRFLTSATVHPDYATNPSRDIAVLRLEGAAPESPVPWNEAQMEEVGSLSLTLVGFGDPGYEDDEGPRLRRTVDVELSEITGTTLRWNEVGAGTCHGDSGGAVYADMGAGSILVGLNSEGDPLCSGWGSAVRTDVFAEFLEAPIGDDDDDDGSVIPSGDDDDHEGPIYGCRYAAHETAPRPGWSVALGVLAFLRSRRRR